MAFLFATQSVHFDAGRDGLSGPKGTSNSNVPWNVNRGINFKKNGPKIAKWSQVFNSRDLLLNLAY